MTLFKHRRRLAQSPVVVNSLYYDMIQQPHLLIAGATGSGKSVLVNQLLHTLLSYSTPGLILIDCKGVELSEYRSYQNTLDYADSPAQAVKALEYAVDIMQSRYKQLQAAGLKKWNGADIYIIIDEFADLMTTSKKAVQPLIQRLAQLGRAAKIHIILCTQCPLRDIIPTAIKCNFDSRIALRTATAQDSRNILGIPGAESLPNPRTAGKAEAIYKHDTEIDIVNLPIIAP